MTITRVYTFYFYYKGKEVTLETLIEIIKRDGIRQVLLDLGGTIVDLSPKTKDKMREYVNIWGDISQDKFELAVHHEWDFRRKNAFDQAIVESVDDEHKEKEYWLSFYTSVLERLEIRAKRHNHVLSKLIDLQMAPESYDIYPFMKDLIEHLARLGIQLGLVSNSFPSSEKIFEKTGLQSKFSKVIFSHHCKRIKPNPDIYQLAIDKTILTPDKTLFIDDHKLFVSGAEKLGMQGAQICVISSRILDNRRKGKKSRESSFEEQVQYSFPFMMVPACIHIAG